jgi:hypothetical protein
MDIAGIVDAVASHVASLGYPTNKHEPKAAPTHGITAAVWMDGLKPDPANSGLSETTVVLTLCVRLYTPMGQQPYDQIDPQMLIAVDQLMSAYSGDFELGGEVRNIDLLGKSGAALSAKAGYLDMNGQLNRVVTITVPMIINDAWAQA